MSQVQPIYSIFFVCLLFCLCFAFLLNLSLDFCLEADCWEDAPCRPQTHPEQRTCYLGREIFFSSPFFPFLPFSSIPSLPIVPQRTADQGTPARKKKFMLIIINTHLLFSTRWWIRKQDLGVIHLSWICYLSVHSGMKLQWYCDIAYQTSPINNCFPITGCVGR